jgi:hypothetical protein
MICNYHYTKKKRGQITSSTYSRYRQTPNYLKRVMAHANSVNYQLKFLIVFLNFADFGIQESKVDVQILYVLEATASIYFSAHRHFSF